MDYHSPHPRRIPRLPIALVGSFGVPVVPVAFHLGALTGLPAASLADRVTHDAGRDEGARVERDGAVASAERELELLRRMLRETPPGVIALTPNTLLDARARTLVSKGAVLIHLDASVEWCLERLREELERRPRLHTPWLERETLCDATLQTLLDERRAGFEDAVLQARADRARPTSVALELAELLDLLPGDDEAGDDVPRHPPSP